MTTRACGPDLELAHCNECGETELRSECAPEGWVLIDEWRVWCPDCLVDMPGDSAYQAGYRRGRLDGAAVVGGLIAMAEAIRVRDLLVEETVIPRCGECGKRLSKGSGHTGIRGGVWWYCWYCPRRR